LTDFTRLENFCKANKLSNDQISELFDIIKEMQTDTINQCYEKILAYRTKRGDKKE